MTLSAHCSGRSPNASLADHLLLPRVPEESLNTGVLARHLALSLLQLDHRVTVVTPNKPVGIALDPSLKRCGCLVQVDPGDGRLWT